jgi:hypothetical protein
MPFQEKKSPAALAWENRIVLPKSPDTPVYGKSARAPAKTRLKLVSRKKNAITDTAQWRASLGLGEPILHAIPTWVPQKLDGMPVVGYIPEGAAQGDSDRMRVALYGKEFSEASCIIRLDEAQEKPDAMLGPCLDFSAWQRGGRLIPVSYVHGLYKELFISTAINGYAREVKGKTGYLSVLRWNSGELQWHAGPRVANARNFALVKDVVVCGYGFTDEPDALSVLDVMTGRTLQTIPLVSAPELIHYKDNKVHVRCYNTDYVFRVLS